VVHGSKPPSQRWRTFLENHLKAVVSVDFFTVPILRFRMLWVFCSRLTTGGGFSISP
jgi:hypothetical protein